VRAVDFVFGVFFVLFFMGWLAFDMPVALKLIDPAKGFYAQRVDPIFQDPPPWLRAVSWFAFLYGPFYGATAAGLFLGADWLPYVALPLAGMVFATTTVYFVEEIQGDVKPVNWRLFYALNVPYLVVPPVAAVWSIFR
jgi:hypothetical protein